MSSQAFINRIVPRSFYNQDLTWAMRNELRDPLWTLYRQKQLGEFDAFDGGAPVHVYIDFETANPHTFVDKNNNPYPINNGLPYEPQIQHLPYIKWDLSASADFTQRLKLLLEEEQILGGPRDLFWSWISEDYNVPESVSESSFDLDSGDYSVDAVNEENALNFARKRYYSKLKRYAGKVLDFQKIFKDYPTLDSLNALAGEYASEPDVPASALVSIFTRLYYQAKESGLIQFENPYWDQKNMTYSFGMKVQHTDPQYEVELKAPDYAFGDIDWYQLDRQDDNQHFEAYSGATNPSENGYERLVRHYMPTLMSFYGKPSNRWWQLEDYSVNFDGLKPAREADLSVLVMQQFITFYSNDWFVCPLSVPLNSYNTIKKIVVTDHFGVKYLIKSQNELQQSQDPDTVRWSIFEPHHEVDPVTNYPTLYAAGSKDFQMRSQPVEEVQFFRDEMSNILYAIETKVPDGLGQTISGHELNSQVTEFYQRSLGKLPPLDPESSENPVYSYKISNQVPENWIPFVPSTIDGREYYQRAKFPRQIEGYYSQLNQYIRPKTSILNPSRELVPTESLTFNASRLNFNSVGAELRWNRIRWKDGRIALWLSADSSKSGREDSTAVQSFDNLEKVQVAASSTDATSPAFNIDWVPSRRAHFVASVLASPQPSNNDLITSWRSKRLNASPLTKAGVGEIRYKSTDFVDKPSFQLDRTSQFQVEGDWKATGYTFFLVYKGDVSLTPTVLLSLRENAAGLHSDDIAVGYGLDSSAPEDNSLHIKLPGDLLYKSYYSGLSRPGVLTVRLENINPDASTSNSVKIRINGYNTGELEYIGSKTEQLPSQLPLYAHFVVGDSDSGLEGLVAEVIVYGRALSNREITGIEKDIQSRYNF